MTKWDYLTEQQQLEAYELARLYRQRHPRTLPTYAWMIQNSPAAKAMSHNTLIAFGRAVLSACKNIKVA